MTARKFEIDCSDDGCLHCAISGAIRGEPIAFENICQVGQVVADMIASMPDTVREQHGREVRQIINKMIDQAIAGTWPADAENVGHA